MLKRQAPRRLPGWLRPPLVGWLAVAALYLIAAALCALLTVAVDDWWPLLLAIASTCAAAICLLIGFDYRGSSIRADPAVGRRGRA